MISYFCYRYLCSEVAKRFPSVQFLDFQPVQENLRPVQANLPVPVQSSFFDQDNSRIAAQDMLSKFFPLFDTDRKSLIDLYDTQSTFSVVFSKGNFNQENSWGSSKGKKMRVKNRYLFLYYSQTESKDDSWK